MLGTTVSCTIANGQQASSELPFIDGLRPCAIYCLNYTTTVTFDFRLRTPDSGMPGITPAYALLDTEAAAETVPATDNVWVTIPELIGNVLASGAWILFGNAAEGAGPITVYVRYTPF